MSIFAPMIKKVVMYGLPLGSAATAMHLIYWQREIFRTSGIANILPLLGNVVFTGLAVWMFLRSLMRENSAPVNLGKALFGSLLTSLLVGMCTVAGLQHVLKNETQKVKAYEQLTIQRQIDIINRDYPQAERPAMVEKAQQYVAKQLDPMTISVSQIQMCLSTGVVIALLVFVVNSKRQ